jgi:hypothetical protein
MGGFDLCFTRDGRSLLAAGLPTNDGRPNVALWDLQTGKPRALYQFPAGEPPIESVQVGPNPGLLAALHVNSRDSDGTKTVWKLWKLEP